MQSIAPGTGSTEGANPSPTPTDEPEATMARDPLKVCVNSQTPLVQFLTKRYSERGRGSAPAVVDLDRLTEGVDYRLSPGGVTRMVLPLVRRLLEDGTFELVDWVALNPNAPPQARISGVTLHHVALPSERMADYAKTKEAIWGRIHETDRSAPNPELFWSEAFSEYAFYNRRTTELIQRIDSKVDFDVFYIHDFQQLAVGHMLGTLKPKLFRWHIPFDHEAFPDQWRALLTTYLDSYDVVVVSSKKYARSLKAFGYSGRVVCLHPYLDPSEFSRPGPERSTKVLAKYGVGPEVPYGLVVARMDPTKSQDRAIEALAEIGSRFPNLRLVLVGNGSFSGSGGGLGLSKSALWRAHLEEQAEALGIRERVVFTGHVPQFELDCFYERAAFTVLPSVREGFGLVVVESWLHRKPAIVTTRAGIAEMIRPGKNGILFDPDHPGALAGAMASLAEEGSEDLRARLGREGFRTAKRCFLDAAVRGERELLVRTVGG